MQNPSPTAHWRFSICLTVPPGTDLTGTPFSSGSSAVIYGRGKLLLFVSNLYFKSVVRRSITYNFMSCSNLDTCHSSCCVVNMIFLFQLTFQQTQGGVNFTLPLMHDPRSNITYVARFQNQYRHYLHQPSDTILRKSSQEMNSSGWF